MTIKIGRITAQLMKFYNKCMVDKNDFLMALVLYFLSERKIDFDQIEEKLSILDISDDIIEILNELQLNSFIEKENDFYKIKLDSLFLKD